MYKATSLAFLVVFLGFAAGAHGQVSQLAAVASALEEEAVAVADLGVAEPTLLPSSPFYFFKDLGRGIQRAFTFNPIRRAELELRFADEKIAEAKKLAEVSPERTRAVERAIENYRTSSQRLKARFEILSETSANPNVDRLLEKLADRTVKHEKLFAELQEKFSANAALRQKLETVAERIGEAAVTAARKDDPAKFADKIERALLELKGSDLKHVRSIEILDRIHEKADEQLRDKLADIRRDFSERLREGIETFTGEGGADAPEALREVLEKLPGDKARRLVILEELRERAAEHARGALQGAAEAIQEEVEKREELAEHAAEAIRHARERLEKLTQAMAAVSAVPEAVTRLSREATAKLDRALKAFEEKKYGQAFGQARSAEVNARNGLRILEQERPEGGDLREDIAELEQKLNAAEERISGLKPELQPKAKEALESSRFRLRLAAETLAKGELRESKRHLEEAKHFSRSLERIFHARPPTEKRERPSKGELPPEARPAPTPPSERPTACTQEFAPICGVDGKTYSNACFARVAGVQIRHQGECRRPGTEPVEKPSPEPVEKPRPEIKLEPAPPPAAPPPPAAAPPPQAVEPVAFRLEADDSGFYPLRAISVAKGTRVSLTFLVRSTNVYFAGLDFRSPKFKTESVKPGGSTQVEFTADEPFVVTSYWPASGNRKAELRVEIK